MLSSYYAPEDLRMSEDTGMEPVGDNPTIELIDWLVERLRQCHGETLPLLTDDLLKDRVTEARNSIASAIEALSVARADKENESK